MSVSAAEFWNLLRQSRLMTQQHVDALGQEYAQQNGSLPQDAKAVSQWLVSRKALSNYQSMILLAGRSGPFHYGQYMVYDRIEGGRLGGMFRALHAPSRHPVLLQFAAGLALADAGMWRLISDHAERHQAVVHAQLNRCCETVDLASFKFAALEDLRGEPAEACRIARAAALALTQLHAAGLVHGDVRPSNLWIEATGNVKLLRDPLALPSTLAQLRQTSPEKILTRADYLAPELAQPDKRPDAQSDLYALGCTLYQLLSGRPPFAGGDAGQKLHRHAGEAIQPLEQQGIAQPIAQIVTYLMAKNPSVRYQQAMVVAEQLTPYCDSTRMLAQPPAPLPTLAAYEAQLRDAVAPYGDAGGAPPTPPSVPSPSAQAFSSTAGAMPPTAASGGESAAPVFKADDPRRRGMRRSSGAGLAEAINDPSKLLSRQNIIYIASGLTALILLLLVAILVAVNQGDGKPGGNGGVAAADGDSVTPTGNGPANGGPANGGPANGRGANSNGGTANTGGNGGTNTSNGNNGGGNSGTSNVGGSVFVKQTVVPDDGQQLWATPTTGGPISLDYTPAGTKIYLAVRPAEIAAGGEGANVLRALGPNLADLRSRWEAASGFRFEEVEQLIVTLHGDNELRPAFVVRPKPPISEQELVRRWGNPPATITEGEKYYKANGWSFYPAPGQGGAVFTMAAEPEIADVIEKRGIALIGTDVGTMLKSSDADRHVNLIFDPFFLNSGQGDKFFTGQFAKLRPAIAWLVGQDIQTSLVSMHFGSPFYVELSLPNTAAEDRSDVAEALRQRIHAVPTSIEDYMTQINAHPYWRKLSYRLVPMFNFLGDQTRVGTEQDVAVVNAVLPEYAASNLFVGAEMLISSTPGAGPAVAVTPTTKKTPQTIDELLKAKTTIEFPQHDLINAVAVVKQDLLDAYADLPFGFDIKTMGGELMDEGITQNQQVRDFSMKDKTVEEILTAMMMKANPVTTVKSPTEEDQKIIWVLSPDSASSSTQTILITTRKAAKAQGYAIPAVFLP
jgi:hypothetical protein